MGSENVCRFFKFGFCKFKSQCRYKHVTEVCDDQKCNTKSCQKRHPRMCKYFVNFGSCKLGTTCAYAHEIQRNKEIGRLEQKLEELTKIINGKDDVIKNLASKIEDLVKKNNEKDDIIEKLVKDVKELSTKQEEDKNISASSKKVTRVSKKKENIEKVVVTEKASSSETLNENPIDKNEEFIECCSKLLGEIEVKTHKEQNTILGREAMKNAYKNTVSQMEKEKERLNIYEFDLVYFVNKVKLLLKKSEFDENTAEAILDHIKSVNEDLKKISNGEKLQFF